MSLLKLKNVTKKIVINKTNIAQFVKISNKRKIRDSKVKELYMKLRNGVHFESELVVSRCNGKYTLTDGCHRISAIERMIEDDSSFSIEVKFAVFDNQTVKEQRDTFETYNIGVSQSSDDFIQVYWETIPLRKQLETIPTSIYLTEHAIKLKLLMGNQILAKTGKLSTGGYSGNNLKTLEDFRNLTLEDIDTAKQFLTDMSAIFGPFDGTNIFWKGTPVTAFYRIWYNNLDIPRSLFEVQFTKVFLGPNKLTWAKLGKSGGREASKLFHDEAMKSLKVVRGMGIYKFKE